MRKFSRQHGYFLPMNLAAPSVIDIHELQSRRGVSLHDPHVLIAIGMSQAVTGFLKIIFQDGSFKCLLSRHSYPHIYFFILSSLFNVNTSPQTIHKIRKKLFLMIDTMGILDDILKKSKAIYEHAYENVFKRRALF